MPATSDFVKKLYKMLEDNTFANIVSWGPQGDCFVVKDMNEFTKTILPRMFKHSNFASFVRQLNKYDFHKVKNTDDNQFGEHSWTFRHPDFRADNREALENIKRKVPAGRKSTGGAATASTSNTRGGSGGSPSPAAPNASVDALQNQLERMNKMQEEMSAHIRNLESNYQNVLTEMVNFQRNMAQQDGLMQNLIQYFLQLENGKVKAEEISASQAGYIPDANPFLPATEAQRMMGSAYTDPTDLARASLAQMNEISRRAEVAGMTFSNSGVPSTSASAGPARPPSSASRIMAAAAGLLPFGDDGFGRPLSRQDALDRIQELQMQRSKGQSSQSQSMMDAGGAFGGVQQPQPQAPPAQAPPDEMFDADAYTNIPNASPNPDTTPSSSSAQQQAQQQQQQVQQQQQQQQQQAQASSSQQTLEQQTLEQQQMLYGVPFSPMTLNHEGLQVFTVGHLLPRSTLDDENGNWSFDPNSLDKMVVMPSPPLDENSSSSEENGSSPNIPLDPSSSTPATPDLGAASTAGARSLAEGSASTRPGSAQTLRVRRSTYVPGWAVPPRVLLVDDDAVSRRLSSKFLQVFGCTIDVAVDGIGAVNKMNLEKYDLVLMDIVMPKLDGVSATSLIRQFDHMTPIISMTSNSKPAEILKYYHSGMNDILPKPFTKDGLLDMLEKHLMHLKVIQTMSRIPRSVGIPPLSDPQFDQALISSVVAASSSSASSSSLTGTSASSPETPATSSSSGNQNSMQLPLSLREDDGRINPLAGMGLSDEQYVMILGNIMNSESFMGMGNNGEYNGDMMGGMSGMSPTMGMGNIAGLAGLSGDSSKRPLDDPVDTRDGKRGRFEVIE
ncbi:HSF-type DNA-binding-domain-containing protein [Abortiporus biennis]|nr:HSF-type DNA-binding-domain-containing protein [Abortiporus biennis]